MSDYTFNITITIPEEQVRASVAEYISKIFDKPVYGSIREEVGYNQVKQQTEAYIRTLDLKPMIDNELQPILKRVMSEVISGQLARDIREIIQKEIYKGELLSFMKDKNK